MKIGAGGLQSQVVEEGIKYRQVDTARSKPGMEETLPANPIEDQEEVKKQLVNRPVTKAMKNAEVDNFTERKKDEGKGQKKRNKAYGNTGEEENKKLERYKVDTYV